MAKVISEVCQRHRMDRDVLLRWGSTSDGEVDGPSGKALSALRRELEGVGLIEPRVRPADCEDHWFTDLNTGERIRTKRGK